MELADTKDLGSFGESRAGSSPVAPTKPVMFGCPAGGVGTGDLSHRVLVQMKLGADNHNRALSRGSSGAGPSTGLRGIGPWTGPWCANAWLARLPNHPSRKPGRWRVAMGSLRQHLAKKHGGSPLQRFGSLKNLNQRLGECFRCSELGNKAFSTAPCQIRLVDSSSSPRCQRSPGSNRRTSVQTT